MTSEPMSTENRELAIATFRNNQALWKLWQQLVEETAARLPLFPDDALLPERVIAAVATDEVNNAIKRYLIKAGKPGKQ